MSTQTLSRLTVETMANYRAAATQVVAASGAGSRRLVRAVDGTLQSQVVPRAARLAPRAGERIDTVRGTVSHMAEQGIEQAVERAEKAIALGSDFAVAQVTRLAELSAELRNPIVAEGLNTAARLSLPAAQLALVVSSKVAEGASQLASAAGAQPAAQAAAEGVKATRRRATSKAVNKAVDKAVTKGVTKGVSKAKVFAKAAPKTVARRSRKAAA